MNTKADYRFVKPLDVLILRGNKLFGGAGDHGDALMPPWPSIISGALRSRILADADTDFNQYSNNVVTDHFKSVLGTPAHPGSFSISLFTVARFNGNKLECFYSMPADLFLADRESVNCAEYLRPQTLPQGIAGGSQLAKNALLKTSARSKPQTAYWLNESGWRKYHQGDVIQLEDMEPITKLWVKDNRLGIAINAQTRTAEESKIYTTDVIQFMPDTGFIVGVQQAEDLLPVDGLIRLGGDGHAASLEAVQSPKASINWKKIEQEKRFRLITTTPAIFKSGWLPPAIDQNSWQMEIGNSHASLVCASINRHQVVSGWDLANWRPKDALKTVPIGSVYWFDNFSGEIEDLQQIYQQGFWSISPFPDKSRQAEGFNRLTLAPWA